MARRGRVSKWALVRRGRVRSLPVRIPPVPAKEWLRAGPLTRITPEIQALALSFKGSPVSIVRQAMEFVRGFEKIPLDEAGVRSYYAKRTADDIVHSRKVVVADAALKKSFDVQGCVDYCTALVALLRARQIPSVFVRRGNHSVVHFFCKGLWYKADPLFDALGPLTVNELAALRRQRARSLENRNMGEGLDSFEVGVRSLDDFFRFGVRRP